MSNLNILTITMATEYMHHGVIEGDMFHLKVNGSRLL